MLKYISKEEYKTLLGVNSAPDDFDNLVIKASAYINHKTFGRINPNDVCEEVKYVTCLIVDLINEKEVKIKNIGNLSSENIEGWSVSYQDADSIELEYSNKMYDVLRDYLWNVTDSNGTRLLYLGVKLYE